MIREPIVAGRFYESDPVMLRERILACYSHNLGVKSVARQEGRLLALIAPHAGFMYSGPVASHAYARLSAEAESPEVIIILGPKHTALGAPFSVSAHSAWKTPLGQISVDEKLARRLVEATDLLKLDEAAHRMEHSIEVQLPFVQHVFAAVPPVVPVALGFSDFATISRIARDISQVLAAETRKVLIIVSSDFSHDTPRQEAYKLDAEVIDRILQADAKGFYDMVVGEDRSVCGVMPITALLVIMQQLSHQAKLLKYATSMDVTPHDRGVGYAAISFETAA